MIGHAATVFLSFITMVVAFHEDHNSYCLTALKVIASGLRRRRFSNSLKKNEKALHHKGREHILINS